jgi:hypothetical protein
VPEFDEAYLRANTEANETFERLRRAVEESVDGGAQQVSVLDTARQVGMEIDERVLEELHLPEFVPVQRFLPWHVWWPWRPLLCWWWRGRWPWYRCPCDWYWYRCHWWVD